MAEKAANTKYVTKDDLKFFQTVIENLGDPVSVEFIYSKYIEKSEKFLSEGDQGLRYKVFNIKSDYSEGDRIYVKARDATGTVYQKIVQKDKPNDLVYIEFDPGEYKDEREEKLKAGVVTRYHVINHQRKGCPVEYFYKNPKQQELFEQIEHRINMEKAETLSILLQALDSAAAFAVWGKQVFLKKLVKKLPKATVEAINNYFEVNSGKELVINDFVKENLKLDNNSADFLKTIFAINYHLSEAKERNKPKFICTSHLDSGKWMMREDFQKLVKAVPKVFKSTKIKKLPVALTNSSNLVGDVKLFFDEFEQAAQTRLNSLNTGKLPLQFSFQEFITGLIKIPPDAEQFFPGEVSLKFQLPGIKEFQTVYCYDPDQSGQIYLFGLGDWLKNTFLPGSSFSIIQGNNPDEFKIEYFESAIETRYMHLDYNCETDTLEVKDAHTWKVDFEPQVLFDISKLQTLDELRKTHREEKDFLKILVDVFQSFETKGNLHLKTFLAYIKYIKDIQPSMFFATIQNFPGFIQLLSEFGSGTIRLNEEECLNLIKSDSSTEIELKILPKSDLKQKLERAKLEKVEKELAKSREKTSPRRKSEDISSQMFEVNISAARKAMNEGDHKSAANLFSQVLKITPDNFESRFGFLKSRFHLGDYRTVKEELEPLIKENPENIELRLLLLRSLQNLGEKKAAAQLKKEFEIQEVDLPEFKAIEAYEMLQREEITEVIKLLESIPLPDDTFEHSRILGQAYYHVSNFSQAIKHLLSCVSNPASRKLDMATEVTMLVNMFATRHDWKSIVNLFELHTSPVEYNHFLNYGLALEKLNNFTKAKEVFQSALEHNPNSVLAKSALERLGHIKSSVESKPVTKSPKPSAPKSPSKPETKKPAETKPKPKPEPKPESEPESESQFLNVSSSKSRRFNNYSLTQQIKKKK